MVQKKLQLNMEKRFNHDNPKEISNQSDWKLEIDTVKQDNLEIQSL